MVLPEALEGNRVAFSKATRAVVVGEADEVAEEEGGDYSELWTTVTSNIKLDLVGYIRCGWRYLECTTTIPMVEKVSRQRISPCNRKLHAGTI